MCVTGERANASIGGQTGQIGGQTGQKLAQGFLPLLSHSYIYVTRPLIHYYNSLKTLKN